MVVALCACLVVSAPVAAPARASNDPAWLQTLNAYRAMSGLAPVVEEPAWSAGIVNHLQYLQSTPADLLTGPYASVHDENPASPFYTDAGAAAGRSANLGTAPTARDAMDEWLTAPFHALGMLQPGLRRSAFGQLGTTVGLDVVRGIEPAPAQQVLFPGDGAVVDLDSYSGHEMPNPLESCVDSSFSGLPIVAMLTSAPSDQLTASLTTPDGTVLSGADELCVVTEHTYRTTDALYGGIGLDLLRGSHAVLLFPRRPLLAGTYRVSIEQPARPSITWGFGVGATGSSSAFVGPDAPLRVRAGSPGSTVIGTVTVDGPVGAGFLTVFPCASGRPEASSLNYVAGQTVANMFVSQVDGDGFVCVFAMSPTHVIVDVVGETSALPGLHAPVRLVDTRVGGGRVVAGGVLRVRAGSPGSTVIGTVTVDGPVGAGFLTVFPCASGRPEASSLNYVAGQTVANMFVSQVDGDGFVCVFAMSPTHVIVDVVGDTTALSGLHSPERLIDTRQGIPA